VNVWTAVKRLWKYMDDIGWTYMALVISLSVGWQVARLKGALLILFGAWLGAAWAFRSDLAQYVAQRERHERQCDRKDRVIEELERQLRGSL
jgi:hypothetical protein